MREYEGTDAAFYDFHATGLEGEADFYVQQARAANGAVLEIGCGTGRILIPTAQAGVNVVGLDRSPAMLAIAREKIRQCDDQVQRRIELVEGDVREFDLARRFDLVTVPYRAFLHLLTSEDQRRALSRIREHLTDRGRLVFNVFDPNLEMIVAHLGPTGQAIKKQAEFTHPATGRRVLVMDTRRYDLERQLVVQDWVFDEVDEAGKLVARHYNLLTLRYVFRYEMEHLLELCGYEVDGLYGDFGLGPFRAGGEQIWIARKR
jgi:SAM-dependent methyltransferase